MRSFRFHETVSGIRISVIEAKDYATALMCYETGQCDQQEIEVEMTDLNYVEQDGVRVDGGSE